MTESTTKSRPRPRAPARFPKAEREMLRVHRGTLEAMRKRSQEGTLRCMPETLEVWRNALRNETQPKHRAVLSEIVVLLSLCPKRSV